MTQRIPINRTTKVRKLNRRALGALLVTRLRELDISAKELFRACGTDEEHAYRYTSGHNLPRLDVFFAICKNLGLDPGAVLQEIYDQSE